MESLHKLVETTYRETERHAHQFFYDQESKDAAASLNTVSNGVVVQDFNAKYFFHAYVLGERIGQGGYWKTFKATIAGSPRNSKPYTVKRVGRLGIRDKHKKALQDEINTLRVLDHPNVVKIYQYFPNEMRFYYVVLEYMAGGEMFDRIVKKENYSERVVRDLARVMVSTLKYVHDKGFVHRDIKPANFMFAGEDDAALSLRLTDFGSACSLNGGMIKTRVVTEEYVAPEILLGKSHGVSVDMWSIGVVLFVLLVGDHPFYHKDKTKMFLRIAAGDYDLTGRHLSDEARNFLAKLLTVNPSGRITATQALGEPWMLAKGSDNGELNSNLKDLRLYHAKRKLRAAINMFVAAKMLFGSVSPNPTDADFLSCYEMLEKLGEGAYAQVFKAVPRSHNDPWQPKEFAVKRIDRRKLNDEDRKAVFDEVRILQDLDHPNVINIYSFFDNDPQYFYMVLEMMGGGELFDRVVEKSYFNEQEARNLCRVLLGAVKYIHDQGVVHRDLKPENLLLACKTDDTSIRLADFGFACSVRDRLVSDQCGTPLYVAPEILWATPYGASVDMWSTGVIIFIILGGYPPFHDHDQRRLFRKIKAGHFRFDPRYWDEVSDEAKDLIRKLLTVDPERRLTASEAIRHPWLATSGEDLATNNLEVGLKQLRIFNATSKLRAAIHSVVVAKKIAQRLGIEYGE